MYGIDVQDIHVLFFRIFKSYGDVESHMRIKFKPHNPPGPRLGRMITREKLLHFTKAVDFLLFLTANIIEDICFNTNLYGWLHILEKTSYADAEGCWKEVDRSELLRFIGLIIYMGIVKVSSISRYWSTAPPPSTMVFGRAGLCPETGSRPSSECCTSHHPTRPTLLTSSTKYARFWTTYAQSAKSFTRLMSM